MLQVDQVMVAIMQFWAITACGLDACDGVWQRPYFSKAMDLAGLAQRNYCQGCEKEFECQNG